MSVAEVSSWSEAFAEGVAEVAELGVRVIGFAHDVEDGHGNPLEYWHWGPVRDWFRTHFGSDIADRFDREIDAANQAIKPVVSG